MTTREDVHGYIIKRTRKDDDDGREFFSIKQNKVNDTLQHGSFSINLTHTIALINYELVSGGTPRSAGAVASMLIGYR